MDRSQPHLLPILKACALVLAALFSHYALAADNHELLRGPYLQKASDTAITVRWRTSNEQDAVVRFGTNANNLNRIANDSTIGTDHSVTIEGLSADTRYFYSVGNSNSSFSSDANQYFDTHPIPGTTSPTRIWVLGDSGTADSKAASVRDSYVGYNGDSHADVWLMLGDNAYNTGTDTEYQNAVFDMYPQTLKNSALWSTLGNHDGHTADSDTQSGPYYDIFSFPTAAESGGIPSGTEAYYSFDYGNIHFVSLDSYETARFSSAAMEIWLQNDLAATTQEWIIAFWHHPPYTKGSHDSDEERRLVDMRETFVPILENYGVDLVLSGHSHSYERSMLINGHYGSSNTFDAVNIIDDGNGNPSGSGAYRKANGGNNGAIYSVAGSSGKLGNGTLDHPVMVTNLIELGSMVIDVNGDQLDAVFLNDNGEVRDSFRIVHDDTDTPTDTTESHAQLSPESGELYIGRGVLDKDKEIGPSWMRVDFAPLTTGTHTISVSWESEANLRYSIFRERDQKQLGKTDITASPSQWIGELDASESYYLGVWSTSGSTIFTATIKTDEAQPTSQNVLLTKQGSVDSNRVVAPRWVRIDFDSPTTANYIISASWDSDADVRFLVNESNLNSSSPLVAGSNPAVWNGILDANKDYYVGLWSENGSANFSITIETTD